MEIPTLILSVFIFSRCSYLGLSFLSWLELELQQTTNAEASLVNEQGITFRLLSSHRTSEKTSMIYERSFVPKTQPRLLSNPNKNLNISFFENHFVSCSIIGTAPIIRFEPVKLRPSPSENVEILSHERYP